MTKTKRPLKAFLCHAHSDKDAVKALYTRLTKDGVDAWLDKENLIPGQDWKLEIEKGVREADVVIVCLSKRFNQEGFRQKEVRWALDKAMEKPEGEIFIIPARLEECDVFDNLLRWHWVNLFERDGYEWLRRSLRKRAETVGAEFLLLEEVERKNSETSLLTSTNEMTFCLWGLPGSGKSTYLTMLPYANTAGWSILPHGDQETQEITSEYSEMIRGRLEFIPPTIVDKIWYFTYDVFPPTGIKNKPHIRVKLPEAAGEYYEKLEYHFDFFGELSRAQGIIWLIDPERYKYPDVDSNGQDVSISKWLSTAFRKFVPLLVREFR